MTSLAQKIFIASGFATPKIMQKMPSVFDMAMHFYFRIFQKIVRNLLQTGDKAKFQMIHWRYILWIYLDCSKHIARSTIMHTFTINILPTYAPLIFAFSHATNIILLHSISLLSTDISIIADCESSHKGGCS